MHSSSASRGRHDVSGSLGGAPSLSSIRSSSAPHHGATSPVGYVSGSKDEASLTFRTHSPVHARSSSALDSLLSTVGDIGKEAKELTSRMQIDINHIRNSVDLKSQTDRALLLSADQHFQAAAKLYYYLSSASAIGHDAGAAPVSAFHFYPLCTSPMMTLRLQDARIHSALGGYNALSGQVGYNVSRRTEKRDLPQPKGPFQHDCNFDTWISADQTLGKPKGDRPAWNVSTQPSPELCVSPTPLSVEQPTKEWIESKLQAKRQLLQEAIAHGGGPSDRDGSSVTGPLGKKRTLRFESPDGTVTAQEATSRERGKGRATRHSDPVHSANDYFATIERTFSPNSYGLTMTGLWSQRSSEGAVARPPRSMQASHATLSSRDAAPAKDSKAFYPSIGDTSSRAIGLESSSANNLDDEVFARKHLEAMNIECDNFLSANSPLDNVVQNGQLLCRLVNRIVRNCQPSRHQLKEVAIRQHSAMSIEDVKMNYTSALTRIRELVVPSGCDPIPPNLLYLEPRSILSGGRELHDMWSLIAKLIEIFILKSERSIGGAQTTGADVVQRDVPVKVPIQGRFCETYSGRNMLMLEGSVCNFLYRLGVLPEPQKHSIPSDDEDALVPPPLAAPFLPQNRRHWHIRTTPFATISLPSVLPYLTNGTALCDVVSQVLGVELTVYRNPRVRVNCISNIRTAQQELLKHYPLKISNAFLCDPNPVFEGDKAFLLMLLEDVMRLFAKAPPRKCLPNADQVPFSISDRYNAMSAGTDNINDSEEAPISHQVASASHLAQFSQTERQTFVSESHNPQKWSLTDLAMQREGSVGSQASAASAPFTSSKANPPPKSIRLRAIGVTTTAPSSGRSIVPSDEVQDDLHDQIQEQPSLLPRHLEYLMGMNVEEKELALLSDWLADKLGRSYRYTAVDNSFEVSSRDVRLSQPCFIFSDGIVLAHLVRVLSYHKCPQLDTVQLNPKSTATKRNNIKKILEFLRTEKKTLVDLPFLEDVLVSGDFRAVVLVLRSLRTAYRNHRSSPKV